MKQLFLVFFLANSYLGYSTPGKAGALREIINFKLANNKIVLKVADRQGHDLNIMFDSAANGFLLDSTVSQRLGVVMDSIAGTSAFMNGTVKSAYFHNQDIFASNLLNKLYKSGDCLNLKWISEQAGMRIDGLIGLIEYMKITAGIDFENKRLYISEAPFDPISKQDYVQIKMSYTNAGFEKPGDYSRILKRIPACKIRIRVSDSLSVETNMQFDTGFNRNFALLTTLDVDSVIKVTNKHFKVRKKKTSFGTHVDTIFYLRADSIIIETLGNSVSKNIVISKASNMAISGFGTTQWMCLGGIDFLKTYGQVYFDLINRYIYLKKPKL